VDLIEIGTEYTGHSIPCECNMVYTVQIGCSTEKLEKLAVAEHRISLGHHIQLLDTSILARKSVHGPYYQGSHWDRAASKPHGEGGFSLSKAWEPLIHVLKEWKKALSKDVFHHDISGGPLQGPSPSSCISVYPHDSPYHSRGPFQGHPYLLDSD